MVKNNGTRTITECEIKIIKYGKNNDIVGEDNLSVLGDILPGKARTFHSMTAWPEAAKTYHLFIKRVRSKD